LGRDLRGNGDILAMCEGDDVLLSAPTDDNGAIGTDSSLGVSDFLAVIGGGDAAPLV
jgi:hypothetical protein